MIAGIGIDIVAIERIERIHARFGARMAKHILCESEMAEYSAAGTDARVRLLAKRFAAKEAAVKALGTGFSQGITLPMLCVEHDAYGKPVLRFLAAAGEALAAADAARSWLSISDEKGYSAAVVVLESA